jgi:hypothetical protein
MMGNLPSIFNGKKTKKLILDDPQTPVSPIGLTSATRKYRRAHQRPRKEYEGDEMV